jgi:hypothetical protein
MISTADQDHGDQSPSFHINIHAGIELPNHEIAYTTLKGFAELTEDHNLCIYMNPELSEMALCCYPLKTWYLIAMTILSL